MGMDRLIEKITAYGNPTVAGLDPKLSYIPQYIRDAFFQEFEDPAEAAAECLIAFNTALIDALCDIVPAVKPQAAYYEMYGWQGVRALSETIKYAKGKGMLVITDGKRNDIGSTMQAYAAAHLGQVEIDGELCTPFGGDALTVNGYLGSDGIKPLLEILQGDAGKGIFVLCKTSNPSADELQDQVLEGGESIYGLMGDLCERWGRQAALDSYGYSQVGAVVGATWPAQLAELRGRLPHTFFLVPGYGAQGGTAADVANAFDKYGHGAIVNSSRGIMCAWKKTGGDGHDFKEAARAAAVAMRNDIAQYVTVL